ncbi:MAG: glycosyltransferase family 4 protein [Burkholderiales bacterium]|nr:glycosyltransferase family 4 protein [Burkholderiales bacterium]
MHCHVVNLQPYLGGAEVYTNFFVRALLDCGATVTLHAHPQAPHWGTLAAAGARVVPAAADTAIVPRLGERAWIVTHAPVSAAFVDAVAGRHLLTGFCHMPLAGRRAGLLARYDLVYAVSRYVLSTLPDAGVAAAYPEPLLGVAAFERFAAGARDAQREGLVYSWDTRKFRDRVLSWLDPLRALAQPARAFARGPGLTLGIVSAIGPIKQFDLLFAHIAPAIAALPGARLEIFGNGGYRSVTDLKRALRPLGARARFWGRRSHPEAIYPQLDYLMSGLPEKEALGLNIIEAQMQGTPVLAVDAAPFTETVADGRTGYLYRDPRTDGGADFARVLARAAAGPRPDPRAAPDHLARFSAAAFNARVARLIADAAARM